MNFRIPKGLHVYLPMAKPWIAPVRLSKCRGGNENAFFNMDIQDEQDKYNYLKKKYGIWVSSPQRGGILVENKNMNAMTAPEGRNVVIDQLG